MSEHKVSNILDDSVVFVHKLMMRHLTHLGKVAGVRELEELIICFWAANALTGQTFAEFNLPFISAFGYFLSLICPIN